ncbi:atp-binding cassette sub-family b [Holotrichia oblita]|nr:atp-binding cassette sub-family b [Holotrichia oblita]
MLAVGPAILYLVRKQSAAVRPMFVNVREQFSRLNSVCQENISGNRVVKAFTKEDYEIQKFTKENQAYYDANFNSIKTWIKFMPLTDFLAGLLSVILMFAGGIFVILGKLELWQMVTINGYLWAVSNPMRMIGWLINDVQRFAASLDKIYGMMRQKIKIENSQDPVVKEKINGKVEFKNVSFGYDQFNKRDLVLKNISFTAEKGHTIGIVGSTGSGKTTLINLISRYYDVLEGEVLVDGIDVRKYDLHSLRKGITASMQDIFLFSDTIEGNIAYGVPDAPMNDITCAADTASASGFINELQEGYDTIIGERGVGLSGGQKQRLSLARAIAAGPSILILDDTTSAVDMETEHEIQQALKSKYGDITKFIIAHRISSVKAANLILVLEDGEIIERGTHDELVDMKGHYYSLFIGQYGEYAEAGHYNATKEGM